MNDERFWLLLREVLKRGGKAMQNRLRQDRSLLPAERQFWTDMARCVLGIASAIETRYSTGNGRASRPTVSCSLTDAEAHVSHSPARHT